ncbi:hypothetical protein DSCA_62900 [Desulfosarcina alkanivorans]|uniref:site-specific DNA-methyltransferase (adenine-specific) n=1 Tax=Desulfosarcina alkanivorans TaxID=571177 RepID=A0A5K7YVK4_9BACT|nr:N-6 DNA methylase [Desulfosarcina alkanivorans]BBO72360.1 hypothetical protein DSCA_62900 [Desulfosarcina alkanivorans]
MPDPRLNSILANNNRISEEFLCQIKLAINSIGYTDDMIDQNVSFVSEGGEPFFADLVIYTSQFRRDTDTAVISFKLSSNIEKRDYHSDIAPFFALSTPIVILVEALDNDSTKEPNLRPVGLKKGFTKNHSDKTVIPLSRFQDYLKQHQEQFSPRKLLLSKWEPEQLSLFDIHPDLFNEAIRIANKELIERFEKSVGRVIENTPKQHKRNVVQGAIALIGARILRDRLKKDWDITSGARNFLSYADQYLPGYFHVSIAIADRLDPILTRFSNSYDLSQVSIDMVGRFYEKAFVTSELRRNWGIHYTSSLLARTLLSRMPIEELNPDDRVLCDPTCGSGSLLSAGYERLAESILSESPTSDFHQQLVGSIFGNDKDKFSNDVAKMTLMLFHPPHRNNWLITSLDAESDSFGRRWLHKASLKPSIVVANPPFGGVGGMNDHPTVPRARNQRDRSSKILNHCMDIVKPGGLIGIILTETILDQQLEEPTRHRILKNFEILEQWSVKPNWFDGVRRPALAWVLRKTPPRDKVFFIYSLSDVPAPGKKSKWNGTIKINKDSLPKNLVPSKFNEILSDIESNGIPVKKHFFIYNGLQPLKSKIIKEYRKDEKFNLHPWTGGNILGTTPLTDLVKEKQGYLELRKCNFLPSSPRTKLCNDHLNKNEPMVLLRKTRTDPSYFRWSSVALIQPLTKNMKSLAPSESFHVAFSNQDKNPLKEQYLYSLWAILNHPIASLWFYERKKVQNIATNDFRSFPLPLCSTDDDFKNLSKKAKEFLDFGRKLRYSSVALKDVEKNTFCSMIHEIDNIIYKLYNITNCQREVIEDFFPSEQRPLFKKIIKISTRNNKVENVSSEREFSRSNFWETTFETLQLTGSENKIKIIIDGFDSGDKNESEGIWVPLTPIIPGWAKKEGATGWIELATNIPQQVMQNPDQAIRALRPHRNAYKSIEDIENDFLNLFNANNIKQTAANE